MSVIFLTRLEGYFWASVWLANTKRHRGEEAFQEINTSGANLRGAAVSWHLMIYSKNKTISPKFWKPFFFFFFGREEEIHFEFETLKKWKTSRAHTFQPNLKGVKHFQMAAGNYCSVCISTCFSLSPNRWLQKWPSFSFFFFYLAFTRTNCVVGQSRHLKGDSDACLCPQILQPVPMCNHFEDRKHH